MTPLISTYTWSLSCSYFAGQYVLGEMTPQISVLKSPGTLHSGWPIDDSVIICRKMEWFKSRTSSAHNFALTQGSAFLRESRWEERGLWAQKGRVWSDATAVLLSSPTLGSSLSLLPPPRPVYRQDQWLWGVTAMAHAESPSLPCLLSLVKLQTGHCQWDPPDLSGSIYYVCLFLNAYLWITRCDPSVKPIPDL